MQIPDYAQRVKVFQQQAQQLRSRYERLAWLRLLAFLALTAGVILLWSETPWWSGLIGTILGIAAFARLVRVHSRIQEAAQHQTELALLNEAEAIAQTGDHHQFPGGEAFIDTQHPYTYDLDFFGAYSIFQLINRAATSLGQARLAAWLKAPTDNGTIRKRQEAATELAEQVEWQHELRAYGAALEEQEGEIDRLYQWLEEDYVVLDKPIRRMSLWIAPLLFIIGMVVWIFYVPWFIAILFLLPAGWWLAKSNEDVQRLHNQTGKVTKTLRHYAKLIGQIEAGQFQSTYLKDLQARFKHDGQSASGAIRQLAYRLSQLDVRYNSFAILLEFSIVWDLQQAYRLDKWQAAHRQDLPLWFDALAELEALVSLGNLYLNHPDWTFPELIDTSELIAEELGHPLLPRQKCVPNNLQMPTHGHMHLITGSNMAGKSTWLRTVGSNIALALAGAPVRARRLVLPQLQVYTSMRTQDALHESTSSFFAELKRLKFILEAVEDPRHTDGRPVFFLLDEILKGTNSRDRHTGAKALIRQLIASRGAGLIATHDLELGALEAEANGQIENWAIEVAIQDGELYFDYTLKRGVSESFNATILMQRMGIQIREV